MAKSKYAQAVDWIQKALRPRLKTEGFRVRGRAFNRVTSDGLTQVVGLQMGPSDPPGTTYFPGLRENLHGLFTVNLGVYVPEVARNGIGGEAGSWVQSYDCCVRVRLLETAEDVADGWWKAVADENVLDDVWSTLAVHGLPYLERFSTRDRILDECRERPEALGIGSELPRLIRAKILAERGDAEGARALLAEQVRGAQDHLGHQEYVRELAVQLGLRPLDC